MAMKTVIFAYDIYEFRLKHNALSTVALDFALSKHYELEQITED
jgi:hypothetical protein